MGITRHIRVSVAALVAALLAGGCASHAPVNLAFMIDTNQPVLTNVMIEGHPGRFVIATAMPRTLLGRRFVARHHLDRFGPFHGSLGDARTFRIDANVLDLEGSMDGVIGADVLGPVVTIDYRRRIATVSREYGDRDDMESWSYRGTLPSIPVDIDGSPRSVIVDTALPDNLVIPREWIPGAEGDRANVTVDLAGVRFEQTDVALVDADDARIGNRLLSRFLVVIDYPHHTVALWQQP